MTTDTDIANAIAAYEADRAKWREAFAPVLDAGEPASEAFAVSIGADYICAMSDGTIVAWGAERADGYREITTYAPVEQVAA